MDLMLKASRALGLLRPLSLSRGGIGGVYRGLLRVGLPLYWYRRECMKRMKRMKEKELM